MLSTYIIIAVFLELITAHKKSLALQETSSKVSESSAKPTAVNDGLSNTVKQECSNNVSYSTHRTSIAAETSLSSVIYSSAEYAQEGHLKKIPKNVSDRTATSLADGGLHKVLRCEDIDSSYLLCTHDVQNEEISDTRCGTSLQKKSFRAPDVISALACDMVNLYRSKVLPKNNSVSTSSCPPPAISASAANNRVENARILCSVTGDSSPVQFKRTVATKIPHVSKSPFKLVKAKTVQSSACFGETILPPVLKSLQATMHFDRSAHNNPGKRTQSSVLTSFCHLDSRPCSSPVKTTRTVSYSSTMPKNLSVQITQATSSHSNAIFNPSNYIHATVPSCTNVVHGTNANQNVTFASSKYKLIRRREAACKNTSRRTLLKDTNISPFVPQRVVKHTPTLLVVNKYKLVRKKRRSLTLSAKRTPLDVKRMAPPVKQSHDVLSPPCRNSLVSNLKTRLSRYKLVRKNDQPHSKHVKKPVTQSPSNHANDKAQVVSKYKLVRRKSTTMLRTPQRATSTPADRSQYSLCNKHVTPPLFLNKYKLIRKRALLKTNSICSRNFSLRSPHYLMRSRKPSAERYKQLYSRKRHASLDTSSLYKKRATRKQSFLSKYALQRSGKGRQYFLF